MVLVKGVKTIATDNNPAPHTTQLQTPQQTHEPNMITDIVTRTSHYDFKATITRLTQAIADKNLTLFSTIDHAQAAHDVGLKLPPTQVLIFGTPVGGTPIMQTHPRVALDLPFRVLIAQNIDKSVSVSYHPANTLAKHGLNQEQIDKLNHLAKLVDAVIQ